MDIPSSSLPIITSLHPVGSIINRDGTAPDTPTAVDTYQSDEKALRYFVRKIRTAVHGEVGTRREKWVLVPGAGLRQRLLRGTSQLCSSLHIVISVTTY